MSAAFFQECFLITGDVRIQDVELIATVLGKADLVVTKDELQQLLATSDHNGDYVLRGSDMEMLFTRLSSVEAKVESAPPADDRVVETSVDAKVSCAMSLAELEAALKDNYVVMMHSLPQRVKQLVLENFNNLLLNSVHGVVAELDQEDIVKLRDEKITRGLPDIIEKSVELDTGIYVTHEGGGEQLVLDLVLLPAEDQEEFRTAWSALSEKRQQDAALEVEEQFGAHMSKIGITVDEGDLKVMRADCAN